MPPPIHESAMNPPLYDDLGMQQISNKDLNFRIATLLVVIAGLTIFLIANGTGGLPPVGMVGAAPAVGTAAAGAETLYIIATASGGTVAAVTIGGIIHRLRKKEPVDLP